MSLLAVLALALVAVVAVVILRSGGGHRTPSQLATLRRTSAPHVHALASSAGAVDPFSSSALRDYLRHRGGDITAGVYDVDTRTTYLYRPHVAEQTASIVKVDILATLLHQEQGNGGLSDSQQALAQQMIEISDNDDATALWDEEGGSTAVHEFDQQLGMSETTPNVAWGLTTTTPRDQLKLLRHVVLANQLLDRSSRKYEYDLMQDVIPSEHWGVSGGVDPHAIVALKNGWLPLQAGDWQVNSVGSIHGSGRRYLIAVMTNEDPTEAYGIATIQHVAAAVWRALGPNGAAAVTRSHSIAST